jgi:signal peptidase I
MVGGLAVGVLLVAAMGWWMRRNLLVATVRGRSMQPVFGDGDRVLVRRIRVDAVRAGDVVVLVKPGRVPELMVKRVAAAPGDPVPEGIAVSDRVVPAGQLVVLGDNPDASYDSRRAGYFSAAALVGVVVRRLR